MIILYGADGSVISHSDGAQYDGEKTGGELYHWNTFSSAPNDLAKTTYGTLSDRCATLYHTSALVRACVNKPLAYSIGDGLVFRSRIDADYLGISAKKAEAWSRQFTTLLHLEKLEAGYYEKQPMLAREASITGDALLYFLREDGDEKPFDLIVEGGHRINWKMSGKNLTLGIEHDDFMRRKAVWRTGTTSALPYVDENGNQNVIQFLLRDRPGQMRGFGCVYSEIARAKGLDRVWDAMIERMVQEAIQLGYFATSYSDPATAAAAMAKQARGETPKSGELKDLSGRTNMKGGMYIFENSESMNFNDLKAPGNNFGLANEWAVKMFSMSRGYPPEFLLSEYSTSFTAHKGAMNDAVKKFMLERADFVRMVDYKVNLEYLKHLIRTDQIQVKPSFWTDYKVRRAYLTGTILGPVPGHINPYVEAKAEQITVSEAFTTRDAVAAKYGNDWWPMVDEWEAQQARWTKGSPEAKAAALAADLEAKREAAENQSAPEPGQEEEE